QVLLICAASETRQDSSVAPAPIPFQNNSGISLRLWSTLLPQADAQAAFAHPNDANHQAHPERLAQFERRQSELWRLTFLLLLVLSIVFAVVSWDTIRSLAHRFEALPIG